MDPSFLSHSIGQCIFVALTTGKTYIGILVKFSSSAIHLHRVRESNFQWNIFPGERIVQMSLIQGYAVYNSAVHGVVSQFLTPQ